MNLPTRSGKGRGLAALIPSAENIERRHFTGPERLLDQLVNAGFDVLQDGTNLALCAYLHAPATGEPMLFLRTPAFDTLTPSRAFRLMHRLATLTNLDAAEGAFEWEHLNARYVRTHGPASDGMHMVARARGRFDHGSLSIVHEICRAFGAVAHQIQSGERSDDPIIRLVVSTVGDRVTVEAVIADGAVSHIGRGGGHDSLLAVSRAVLDAVGDGYRFIDVRELLIDHLRAVLSIVADPTGSVRLGMATAITNVNHAAALATFRAITSS